MSVGSALGAKLEYAPFTDSATPVTYVELEHIGDFEFPYGVAERLRITGHNDARENYALGIVDPGVLQVPINWDDAETSHQWVEENMHEKHQWRYTPKNGTAVVFLGVLKSLVIRNPLSGGKERILTIRRSGGATASAAA